MDPRSQLDKWMKILGQITPGRIVHWMFDETTTSKANHFEIRGFVSRFHVPDFYLGVSHPI